KLAVRTAEERAESVRGKADALRRAPPRQPATPGRAPPPPPPPQPRPPAPPAGGGAHTPGGGGHRPTDRR
ncbi:hypothetical protein, partial [Nocardia cyriacigeorgica]|uniref:hypothetical protein n=1 Tax=Nocardia cyriacigeorgica TaxID=135487 RepID=UPI002457C91A